MREHRDTGSPGKANRNKQNSIYLIDLFQIYMIKQLTHGKNY